MNRSISSRKSAVGAMRQSGRANDGVRHRQLERYRPQAVNFSKEIELMEISMLSNRASRRAIHNSEDVQREHDGRPHSLQTSKKELDKKLDKALDESFPSSDPPAVTQPSNNEPAGDPKVEP